MKKNYTHELLSLLEEVGGIQIVHTFDGALDPIAITTAKWEDGIKFIYVNDAFCRETLYKKEEILGQNPKILQGENSNREILSTLKSTLLSDEEFVGQSINYKKDGTEYIVQWSISHIKNKSNETVAYIAFQKILTKYVAIENENYLLQAIVKQSPGMILVTDLESNIVYANDSFCKNIGFSYSELIGHHSRILKSGRQNKTFYRNMWKQLIKTGEYEGVFVNKKKDGTIFYDKKKIHTIKDEEGNPVYYFSVSYDVTKERRNEQRMLDEIYIDSLTKQFNRKKYDQVIEEKMKLFKEEGKVFSFILLDIDFFKKINDQYGHDKGDFILRELSRLCKAFINKGRDELFRWGGEEFIILSDILLQDAIDMSVMIKDVIAEHDFDDLKVTASFGIAQIEEGMSIEQLFKKADEALYEAKKSGRNKVIAN